MKRFVPNYRVTFNRVTGKRAVVVDNSVVNIVAVPAGTSRNFYCHFKTGAQSRLYPTLRDCIINIVYGV